MTTQQEFTRTLAKEGAIKNGSAAILAALAYPTLSQALSTIDAGALSNFLFIISILLITVCFANFAFTYEKAKMKLMHGRLFAHATTFIFMLLIATMLESVAIGMHVIYPSLSVVVIPMTALLYIGLAMYDFWDLLRVELHE
ncbi:MAG: hypothetical protein AAB429_00685 [Patescibacteria group bacterium]